MAFTSNWPSPVEVVEKAWEKMVRRPFEWGSSALDDAPEPNPIWVKVAILVIGAVGTLLGLGGFAALAVTLILAYSALYALAKAIQTMLSPVLASE